LFLMSWDQTGRTWDLGLIRAAALELVHLDQITRLALAPSQPLAVTASKDKCLIVRDRPRRTRL